MVVTILNRCDGYRIVYRRQAMGGWHEAQYAESRAPHVTSVRTAVVRAQIRRAKKTYRLMLKAELR